MNLTNPQTDVVEVYVQVQNYCGATVTNTTLEWDTQVRCNGQPYLGPHDTYAIGNLSNNTGWGRISDWSTLCWNGMQRVPFQMAGFDDGRGNLGANQAHGSYDTAWYWFI